MSRRERLEQIAAAIRAHRGCGFEPCETCTNPVPGEGSADAEVVFVGEAPGREEDRQGRPFVGAAGRLLNRLLASIELSREAVFITNVIKARPPGNRRPTADEIFHSWPWLLAELETIEPRLIVPLGKCALDAFVPGRKITQVHGRAIEYEGRLLFPLCHPAAAHRVQPLGEMFDDYLALRRFLEAPARPR